MTFKAVYSLNTAEFTESTLFVRVSKDSALDYALRFLWINLRPPSLPSLIVEARLRIRFFALIIPFWSMLLELGFRAWKSKIERLERGEGAKRLIGLS